MPIPFALQGKFIEFFSRSLTSPNEFEMHRVLFLKENVIFGKGMSVIFGNFKIFFCKIEKFNSYGESNFFFNW